MSGDIEVLKLVCERLNQTGVPYMLNDVRNLLKALKDLDKEGLKEWIQILELQTVYEKVTTHG